MKANTSAVCRRSADVDQRGTAVSGTFSPAKQSLARCLASQVPLVGFLPAKNVEIICPFPFILFGMMVIE